MRRNRDGRKRKRRNVFHPETGRGPLSQVDRLKDIRPMPCDCRRELIPEKMPFDFVPGSRGIVLPFVRSLRARVPIVRGVFGLEISESVSIFLS